MTDWIGIVAIITGPILAVQVEKILSRIREQNHRKRDVFTTLMATRGTPICLEHFKALNLIELEFGRGKKYAKIIHLWRLYLDNLCNGPLMESDLRSWGDKNGDLMADLLVAMGDSLGYTFDKVSIKRMSYVPKGYSDYEANKMELVNTIVEALDNKTPFSFTLMVTPEALKKQDELADQMIKYYQNCNQSKIGTLS